MSDIAFLKPTFSCCIQDLIIDCKRWNCEGSPGSLFTCVLWMSTNGVMWRLTGSQLTHACGQDKHACTLTQVLLTNVNFNNVYKSDAVYSTGSVDRNGQRWPSSSPLSCSVSRRPRLVLPPCLNILSSTQDRRKEVDRKSKAPPIRPIYRPLKK